MYNVPARFHTLAIADSPQTRCRIYFITDAVNCWDDNDVQTNGALLVGAAGDTDSNGRIGQDGVTINEIFNKDQNLSIGGTVSYQIGMTLVNADGALNNFAFGRCKVYLDVYDDANSTWLPCPLGVFRIDLPVKRKVHLISCTGYDQMQALNAIADTWWNGLNFTGGLTIENILNSMVSQLGLRLTATSITSMVNKTLSFTTPPIDSVERTYRDILGWIAEATGTVAHFNRNGSLDMRPYLTPQIGGNNIVIDTDTTGNQCLSIDVAEYSVSQIDALTIKLTTSDQGVTVGTGTNVYTIMDNPFLYGPDVATIQGKLTPIYNRLSAYATYSPISTRLIYDWSIEAGDIIYIRNNSTTYNMPIFQQKMVWRGGYVTTELISSGDTVRPQISSGERETYRYNVEMATKVGDNEIISKINQTAEQIQIQASKVNLTGYITATNLATPGQTVIDGGNITSNSISVSQFTSAAQGALAANATTKMQYYLSTSSSSATGGTWSDTVPTWASGKYVWTREATTVTLASGSTTTNYSTAVYDKNLTTALSTATSASSAASAAQTTANGANAQEQLIYISKPSGTTTVSTNTTWVTDTTGSQNTWTLKRPEYNSSYPVLFVATQRKAVDGTVTCTTPMIDLTTTVIDGGHITTGTIDASVVSVTNLNASNITSGSLSANYIQGGTMTVGGLNDTNGYIRILDSTGNYAGGVGSSGITLQGEEPYSGLSHVISNAIFPYGYSLRDQTTQKQLINVDVQIPSATDEYAKYYIQGYDSGTQVSRVEFSAYPYNNGAYLILQGQNGLIRLNSDGTYAGDLTINYGGNLTIKGGVLDVVDRRCYTTLSSAGWYRVAKTAYEYGASGTIINFYIGRPYGDTPAEAHKISFFTVGGGNSAFLDEISDSSSILIDYIRCTHDSDYMYFDVHYNTSASNEVYVYFDVYGKGQANGTTVSYGLSNVGPSPAGETLIASYEFTEKTDRISDTTTSGVHTIVERTGKLITVTLEAAGGVSCPQGQYTTVATIPSWAYPKSNIFLSVDPFGANNIIGGVINTSGNVRLYPVLSATTYYRFTITYKTA